MNRLRAAAALARSATSPPAPFFPSFLLCLRLVFDKGKWGLLFEAREVANKQVGWELKFSFPRGRLDWQRVHEASGGDLQPLGPWG